MKKLILSLVAVSTLLSPGAFACSEDDEVLALMLMLTGVSSFTGSTMMASCNNREMALSLKEDAVQYQLSGEKTVLLQKAIDEAHKINAALSEDEVISALSKAQ